MTGWNKKTFTSASNTDVTTIVLGAAPPDGGMLDIMLDFKAILNSDFAEYNFRYRRLLILNDGGVYDIRNTARQTNVNTMLTAPLLTFSENNGQIIAEIHSNAANRLISCSLEWIESSRFKFISV